MPTTLYNLRIDGDQYRVSKFTNGDLEASYLTSADACQCPAGERLTCRHRQMFPDLLPICNTPLFLDYNRRTIVDFNGVLQSPPAPPRTQPATPTPPAKSSPSWRRL